MNATAGVGLLLISPFPPEALPLMWEWIQSYIPQMLDDFSPHDFAALTEKYESDLARGALTYLILADDDPVGAVWAEAVGDAMFIGHLVFARHKLSRAERLSATKQALESMFRNGARKIIWQLYADNRAFEWFLLRLGATVEGRLREGTRRGGLLTDITLMASFKDQLQ